MKQSLRDWARAQQFGPTKFAADGFMGADTRSVDEIIADDARTCAAIGIEAKQIADALDAAYRRAENAFGASVTLSSRAQIEHTEAKGMIPSPFGAEGVFRKGEASITDTRNGNRFYVSPLSIHLIRAHGFFQGRGSRYRLEPLQISETLGLLNE